MRPRTAHGGDTRARDRHGRLHGGDEERKAPGERQFGGARRGGTQRGGAKDEERTGDGTHGPSLPAQARSKIRSGREERAQRARLRGEEEGSPRRETHFACDPATCRSDRVACYGERGFPEATGDEP